MKLRTLDCKNCAAPLRQEGEKLVCRSCGSVFDIPRDSSDIEYERTVNAEDYIRLELAKSILALENSYKNQEQINQDKRNKDLRAKRNRTSKIIGMIVLFVGINMLVWGIIEGAFFFFSYKVSDKKRKAQEAAEAAIYDPGYRVTPSDLKNDKVFWNYINDDIITETKEGYDSWGSVIFSADEIWGVNEDPEIIERCLITTEDSNTLYIIFKVTFENIDGSTKEMYYCTAAEDIRVNEKGKIVYDGFTSQNTDSYDVRFHSDEDLDSIYQTYIDVGKSDYERYYFDL